MPIKDITKKKAVFVFLKKKSPKIHQAFFDVVGGKTLKKCLQMVLGNLFTALHLVCDLHQATQRCAHHTYCNITVIFSLITQHGRRSLNSTLASLCSVTNMMVYDISRLDLHVIFRNVIPSLLWLLQITQNTYDILKTLTKLLRGMWWSLSLCVVPKQTIDQNFCFSSLVKCDLSVMYGRKGHHGVMYRFLLNYSISEFEYFKIWMQI